ncbi:DUF222 domain-containing protein [Nocardioides panacis]|uniref:DUF222 domain-containing protein n=1 Tax=Nocardioides panacis TaxID=2849501 RepID=A0A975XYL5_9ACTN|nr:DUF222 domain-containing protein [Nocardioides panacis]QWZ06500.1 DUF222 domain-containing protein [Nocardioides panacis]
MIEDRSTLKPEQGSPVPGLLEAAVPDSRVLSGWVQALGSLGADNQLDGTDDADDGTHDGGGGMGAGGVVSDAERVEQLVVLERLKAAAAAAQARVTVGFEASQRAAQRAAGVPERRVGAGVAAQVGLARRDSPVKGARHLGLARSLVGELPHTLAALAAGQTSEWRATLIARETACLSGADRVRVDAELAARPGGIGALGDREAAAEARRIGYRLDPHALTDRAARAHHERRVTLRPAPDTMACLSGLLPAVQGVALYAALTRHADTLRSGGDARSRGQIMADTLVERVTGQTTAAAVPVEIALVMTDTTLLGTHRTPADDPHDPVEAVEAVDVPVQLAGYGPLPAPWVRDWLRTTGTGTGTGTGTVTGTEAQVWVRRLYTSPETGQLVAMDSRRRRFTGLLRRFLVLRDQHCRTPWCNAPIRHLDHPHPARTGGPTTAGNAQGLCAACNYAKEAPGWTTHTTNPHTNPHTSPHASTRTGTGPAVETTTPTGHQHHTRPPLPPRTHPTTPHHPTPTTQPRRALLPPRPPRRPRPLTARPATPRRNTWARRRLGTRSDLTRRTDPDEEHT